MQYGLAEEDALNSFNGSHLKKLFRLALKAMERQFYVGGVQPRERAYAIYRGMVTGRNSYCLQGCIDFLPILHIN